MRKYLYILISWLLALPLAAQSDSLKASLLTCAPGTKSYELYGHTALRIQNTKTGDDWVFNYGIFSFQDVGRFTWEFTLGKADYILGVVSFPDFSAEYTERQRPVREQKLNISSQQAAELFQNLVLNAQPENRSYRYNFLRDNCTSRAIDMIGKVAPFALPADKQPSTTYRDIIHSYTQDSPWLEFGQDLILGCDVDTLLNQHARMMFPLLAEQMLTQATTKDSLGNSIPLLKDETIVVNVPQAAASATPFTPLMVAILLLCSTVALSWTELRTGRVFRLFDNTLMLVQGLAGLVVFVLFFFSAQPAVGSNWLIGLLNPLPLIWLPIKIMREHRGLQDYYLPLYGTLAAAFTLVVAGLQLQTIPTAMQLLALCLLMRGLISIIRWRCRPLLAGTSSDK